MNEKELRILLADDDADDCLLFQEALEELTISAKLTTVHNGEQLMLLLNKNNTDHDILFLDLNMPRKNGFDCLSEIRQNKEPDGLAVIPISTSFHQDMISLLYKNGAQHFIRKPNEFSQLKHLIQNGIKIVAEAHSAQSVKKGFVVLRES
ncbi:MAG: response regulator [Bacteroidota bacterium]